MEDDGVSKALTWASCLALLSQNMGLYWLPRGLWAEYIQA